MGFAEGQAEKEPLMVGSRHIHGLQALHGKRRSRPEMVDMRHEKRQFLESPGEQERYALRGIQELSGECGIQDRVVMGSRRDIEIAYDDDIVMFPIGLMLLEILDEGLQLAVPHQEMVIAVRRAGMHQIEIELLSLIEDGEIAVSPSALREVVRFVVDGISAEDHAAYERLGSGGAIGVRIIRLQEILEVLVVLIIELHEHQHIRMEIGDSLLYARIIVVVFMDIGEEDAQRSGGLLSDERLIHIETVELLAIPEKQETESQECHAPEIAELRRVISVLHPFPEMYEAYDGEGACDACQIRQKAHHQFRRIGTGEEEREEQYQDDDKYQRYHGAEEYINAEKI